MYFVFIHRQGPGMPCYWGFAGPFEDAEAAEHCAASAVTVPGTLDARIVSFDQLERERSGSIDYGRAVADARRLAGIGAPA